MKLTRGAGNFSLIECRADQFGQAMRVAPRTARCVLTDGRPALMERDEWGQLRYLTIHPYAWSILKRSAADRARSTRIKRCEFCRSDMRVEREYETSWTFSCPACKSIEVHDKRFVGGTRGAGEKEKR